MNGLKDEFSERIGELRRALDAQEQIQRAARQAKYLDKCVAVHWSPLSRGPVWLIGRCEGVYLDCLHLHSYNHESGHFPIINIGWSEIIEIVVVAEEMK